MAKISVSGGCSNLGISFCLYYFKPVRFRMDIYNGKCGIEESGLSEENLWNENVGSLKLC